MRIWHMTAEAGREPLRVAPGREVRLVIGTSPIEPDQSVTVTYDVVQPNGLVDRGFLSARWDHNEGDASYWSARFGPFGRGDRVTYWVHASHGEERVDLPPVRFTVGPRIYLALLWHQHQPSYVDLAHPPQGSMVQSWVRLRSLQAYYAMPALGEAIHGLRVTYNLTPVLLWQIQQYVQGGATDRALDLTRKPAQRLTPGERGAILEQFFDADWHEQIFPFPRYMELFERSREQLPFSDQDIRDLQMWYNLVWFAPAFQQGTVRLATGQEASVQRFIEQGSDFTEDDIEEMVAEQYKIMAAIIPLHRRLKERGQIEVSTSPFYHPVLPLLYDTDQATIDRPGACLPPRFHHPEDAEAQLVRAIDYYTQIFGGPPRGMWPAEGAVSPETVPMFIAHGIEWIASDQGVLERSGRWGYEAGSADVLTHSYQVRSYLRALSIFFRQTGLSDLISFHYHRAYQDMDLAAKDFVHHVLADVADRLSGQEDHILTLVLDGENTFGAYGSRAPAFFQSLYRELVESPEIETVTFSEYIDGDPEREVAAHPTAEQDRIHELYTGSWIDEAGSRPGVDLGTWIGEPDENRAWGLLGDARDALARAGALPETGSEALDALYMAEGSDWYWWLGTDHPSPKDRDFESAFRLHLRNAYLLAGLQPPPELARPLVPWMLVWTFTKPLEYIGPNEQMVVRTNCRGKVLWTALPEGGQGEESLEPVIGLAGLANRYEAALGPFGPDVREVRLRFRCERHPEAEAAVCARPAEARLPVAPPEEEALESAAEAAEREAVLS